MNGSELSILVAIFLVILGILWILLPFAIFGTKPRLEAIHEELKEIRRLLEDIYLQQTKRDRNDRRTNEGKVSDIPDG